MNTQTTTVENHRQGLNRRLVTFLFLAGIFLGALDHGIVGPALSTIFTTFQVSSSWGVWSFTIYTLVFAISIPVLAKLSDRFGRKETFQFGIAAFALGSLIAALAPNFLVFLLGRAVQAVGAGGIFPITAAQIAATYPPEERGKAMGWIGIAFGSGTILGPLAGGWIISSWDWQWIFLIKLPLSVIIFLLMGRYKPVQQTVKQPVDWMGIALLGGVIFSAMTGISSGNGWLLLIALALLLALVRIERKQTDPVLNVSYFTNPHSLFVLLASLVSGFVMAAANTLLPLYSETVLGLAKGASGVSIIPLAIATMTASLAGGILTDKWGASRVLLGGFLLTAISGLSLAFAVDGMILYLITIVLMGFGIGVIVGAPLNILILRAAAPREMGAAVGYVSLFRSMGSTLGPTVAGLMLDRFADGFSYLYSISALASLLGLLLIGALLKKAA